MSQASDWTERYRPESETLLEGNDIQRRTIRAWLDDWKSGTPKKPGLLLVGPPGVGKTTVARAIAKDMGWSVIELNASDARNAAAIRRSATHGATHRSLFHDPTQPTSRTLILLDEVDHISGGLRQLNEKKINDALNGQSGDGIGDSIQGDSGGKAELLNLLSTTKQPVILACNEEMGLWGRNSTWRSTRDRFSKYVQRIQFSRVNDEAIRRIARRVLREESIEFEPAVLVELVRNNHGDLRALIRDLQVLCEGKMTPLTSAEVIAYFSVNQRDAGVEIFPGLEQLYKTRRASDAVKILPTIDKDPSELMDWVHWNNANLFTKSQSIRRGNQSLKLADRALMSRYTNQAHRSTYWTSHLASLAASTANSEPLQGKLFPSYPHFLRRPSDAIKLSIIEKFAAISQMSQTSVKEEFIKPLHVLLREDSPLGHPEEFGLSLNLGLNADEHVNLCGLAPTRRTTKELSKAYEAMMVDLDEPIEESVIEEIELPIQLDDDGDDEERDSNQMTLF